VDAQKIITVCGRDWAEVGVEFVYLGESKECESCKISKVCLKLKKGWKYKIVGLRNGDIHPCPLHDDGVIAVEVVELPMIVAVESKMAVEGMKVSLNNSCADVSCIYYNLCNPIEFGEEEFVIEKVIGDTIDCKSGKKMRLVELRRA